MFRRPAPEGQIQKGITVGRPIARRTSARAMMSRVVRPLATVFGVVSPTVLRMLRAAARRHGRSRSYFSDPAAARRGRRMMLPRGSCSDAVPSVGRRRRPGERGRRKGCSSGRHRTRGGLPLAHARNSSRRNQLRRLNNPPPAATSRPSIGCTGKEPEDRGFEITHSLGILHATGPAHRVRPARATLGSLLFPSLSRPKQASGQG